MGEISNRTLAVLVILAILVSLLSLFIGRAKIVTVGQPLTTTGYVTANVQADVDIVTEGGIDFGNVIPGNSYSSINLAGNKYIKVASVGSTTAKIGYRTNYALFLRLGPPDTPGTLNPGRNDADDAFNISIWSAVGDSITGYGAIADCNDMTIAGPLGANRTINITTTTTPPNTDQRIVQNCLGGFTRGFKLAIHIRVPDQEDIQSRTSTLTFTGSEY